jgi:heptosyltransferase-1
LKNFKKILIVRLGGVGDVVCTLPAVEALRAGFPSAFIGFLVEERACDLVRGHPALDRVHLFPRRRLVREARNPLRWPAVLKELAGFVRDIRSERYDAALDLQRNLKGAVHSLVSGARRRIGFSRPTAREFNQLFSHEQVTPPPQATHWVDKFLAVTSAVGAPSGAPRYRLPDSPESRARVGDFLAANGLSSFVVIHPTASDFDPGRRWLAERFGELARRLGSERSLRAVVTWGPGERALAQRVAQASGGHALVSFETRSLLDLAELLRRARLYVGCDSGPMHLASAVGLPSVVLFGPGDPAVYGPRCPLHRIVCRSEGGGPGSMEAITVEDAYRAAVELLAEIAARDPAATGRT